MSYKNRLDKLNKALNKLNGKLNINKGFRPRTLEDYFNNTLEGTYIREWKKGDKKFEDFI